MSPPTRARAGRTSPRRCRDSLNGATVATIEPSPFDAHTAYVVVDAHRLDNTHPFLYKTTDLGASWTRLDGALAPDVYLHAVREDPKKHGQLYLGTERGVMFSTDDGRTWRPLQLNLPTVAVHDLIVKDDDLVLATHGRSFWILDDIQPVREYSPSIAAEAVHLFAPADAVRWHYGRGPYGGRLGSFPNPPAGAAIYYSLKDDTKSDVKIDVLDARNQVVKTLSSTAREVMESEDNEQTPEAELSKDAGVHRAVWNLEHEGSGQDQGGQDRHRRSGGRAAHAAG